MTLSFDVFCTWINNREAGDSTHHRAPYDITVMIWLSSLAVKYHWVWNHGTWMCVIMCSHSHMLIMSKKLSLQQQEMTLLKCNHLIIIIFFFFHISLATLPHLITVRHYSAVQFTLLAVMIHILSWRVGEWVIKFNSLFWTADIGVHVVHTRRVIIAYTWQDVSVSKHSGGAHSSKQNTWANISTMHLHMSIHKKACWKRS